MAKYAENSRISQYMKWRNRNDTAEKSPYFIGVKFGFTEAELKYS